MIDFCQLGFIGKMFKTLDLPMLVQFLVMFYNDKPGDWLLDDIVETKMCRLEDRVRSIWAVYRPLLGRFGACWGRVWGVLVVVKWSASAPSTPTIKIQILLKSAIFIERNCLNRTKISEKEVGNGPF